MKRKTRETLVFLFCLLLFWVASCVRETSLEKNLDVKLSEVRKIYSKLEPVQSEASIRLEQLYNEIKKEHPDPATVENLNKIYLQILDSEDTPLKSLVQKIQETSDLVENNLHATSIDRTGNIMKKFSIIRGIGEKVRQSMASREKKMEYVEKRLEILANPNNSHQN